MTPAEKLTAYGPAQGALFPFAVEQVDNLSDWEPKALTIAISGREYRINEADADNIVGRELYRIIAELTGDELTEWKPTKTEAKTTRKSHKPEST